LKLCYFLPIFIVHSLILIVILLIFTDFDNIYVE